MTDIQEVGGRLAKGVRYFRTWREIAQRGGIAERGEILFNVGEIAERGRIYERGEGLTNAARFPNVARVVQRGEIAECEEKLKNAEVIEGSG